MNSQDNVNKLLALDEVTISGEFVHVVILQMIGWGLNLFVISAIMSFIMRLPGTTTNLLIRYVILLAFYAIVARRLLFISIPENKDQITNLDLIMTAILPFIGYILFIDFIPLLFVMFLIDYYTGGGSNTADISSTMLVIGTQMLFLPSLLILLSPFFIIKTIMDTDDLSQINSSKDVYGAIGSILFVFIIYSIIFNIASITYIGFLEAMFRILLVIINPITIIFALLTYKFYNKSNNVLLQNTLSIPFNSFISIILIAIGGFLAFFIFLAHVFVYDLSVGTYFFLFSTVTQTEGEAVRNIFRSVSTIFVSYFLVSWFFLQWKMRKRTRVANVAPA